MVRIVLVGLPTLLAEAFQRELGGGSEPSDVIRCDSIVAHDLPVGSETTGVVVSDDQLHDVTRLAPSIWERSPSCRILTIAEDGHSGTIRELRPSVTELCELRFGQAIDLLREVPMLMDRAMPA